MTAPAPAEGYYHTRPEPVEQAPFCDRCFGHHSYLGDCPGDDWVDDEDDDENDGSLAQELFDLMTDDEGEPA